MNTTLFFNLFKFYFMKIRIWLFFNQTRGDYSHYQEQRFYCFIERFDIILFILYITVNFCQMYSFSLSSGINNWQRTHKIIELKTSTLYSIKVSLYIICGALKKYKTFIPLSRSRSSKYIYLFLCCKISLSLRYFQKKTDLHECVPDQQFKAICYRVFSLVFIYSSGRLTGNELSYHSSHNADLNRNVCIELF